MDEKIELTQKAVRKSVGQETTFVNMLNDEMEMLILSLGYRKESDTAREIFEWLEKHCFFNGFEIVETYFKERYNLD